MRGILHHKEGVDLIPSNSDLFVFEISLVTAMNREAILRNYLNEVNSWGSARETFDWKTMCEVCIPIPDLAQQEAIAKIYKAYTLRKEICEQLKQQIKDICPILIKGSLEEARA